MAQRAEQIIIDVEFNVGQTEKQLGDVTARIKELRNQNEQIRKDLKNGTGDWAANQAILKSNEQELKSLTVAEKDLAGMISVADQQRRKYSDSFRGQAAQLADLKNQYSSLSKAERESAGGQEMLKHLTELDAQVKANDKSMGNFQRNVGNYPAAFDLSGTALGRFVTQIKSFVEISTSASSESSLAIKKTTDDFADFTEISTNNLPSVGNSMKALGTQSTSLSTVAGNAFGAIKTQVVSLGKAFLTPPVAIIAIVLGAIILAAQKLVAAFKRNDEASEKLKQAFSVLEPIAEGISWIFDKLATVVAGLVYGFSQAVKAVLSIVPAYKKAAGEAEELVKSQDKLEESERNYTVNSAWRNKEIARLKKEAVNTQKYTTEQIAAMLKKADDYELANLQEKKKIAAENYKNLVKEAKQKKDTNDNTMKAIAEARARMYQADEEYYSGTLRLATKQNAALEKIEADKKAAEEKAEADRIARREKWLARQKTLTENTANIVKQYEDAIIAGKEESVQKQIEIEQTNTRRQIEELQKQTDLTAEGIKKRDALIEQLKKNSIAKIAQLEADAKIEEQRKTIEAEQKRLQLLFEVVEKGGEAELSLRLQIIENLRQQDLLENGKTAEQIALINKKYDLQEEDAERQSQERIRNLKKQAIDNEFEELRLGLEQRSATAVEFANLELQQATAQAAELAKLDKSSFETKEAYDAAVIESKKRVAAATRSVAEAEQQQFAIQVAAAQGFGDAISSVLSELAGDSKEALVFQKLISLAKVSLSLAESIAAATAASTAGDPYTMAARIAANVASVVIAFSQVTKAIKATQIPQAPRFESGGIVPGASFTGDRITARVNSGEMILNAEQQKNLFRMVANNNYQSGGLDYDLLAKAMSRQPAPALILKEFNDFNQKIVTFDEHTKI